MWWVNEQQCNAPEGSICRFCDADNGELCIDPPALDGKYLLPPPTPRLAIRSPDKLKGAGRTGALKIKLEKAVRRAFHC